MNKLNKVKISIVSFMLAFTMVCNMFMNGVPLVLQAETTVGNTPTIEDTTEHLVNGSFEEAVDSNITVKAKGIYPIGNSGWNAYVADNSNIDTTNGVKYGIVSTDDSDTNHAMKIEGTILITANLYQDAQRLDTTKTYKITAKVKAVDVTVSNGKIGIDLYVDNKSNGLSGTNLTGEWQELIVDEFIPSNETARIKFIVSRMDSGYYLIDDVTIEEVRKDPTIAVSPTAGEMEVGGTTELTATVTDYSEAVVWTSSDEEVASVTVDSTDSKKVTVTAKKAGIATINAAVKDLQGNDVTAACTITVLEAMEAPTINIILENAEAKLKGTSWLAYEATGVGTTITWSSSNTDVATVEESTGKIIGVALGEAVITATITNAKGSASDSCTVSPTYIYNGGFEVSIGDAITGQKSGDGTKDIGKSGWRCWTANAIPMSYTLVEGNARTGSGAMKISRVTDGEDNARGKVLQEFNGLEVGREYELSYWVKPVEVNTAAYVNAELKKINSDNSTVLETTLPKVDMQTSNGGWQQVTYEFKANLERYSFEVAANSFQTGSFLIDDVSLTKIPRKPQLTITQEDSVVDSVDLETGKTTVLTAALEDPDSVLTGAQTIQWSVNDETVVHMVIDEANGNKVTIEALKEGEAIITATLPEGDLETICTINVIKEIVALEGISIAQTLELCAGSQKELEVTFTPSEATDKSVTWTSSNEAVATVDASGMVTALSEGGAEIKATTANGLTATCILTVRVSTQLTTQKAELTTNYGTPLSGDLSSCITNKPENTVITYELFTAPENGVMTVNADGTYTYVPKSNFDTTEKDSFVVMVAAGTETALLVGEITVKELDLSSLTTATKLLISEEALAEVKALIQQDGTIQNKIWKAYEPYLQSLLSSTPPTYESKSKDNEQAMWMRGVGDDTLHLLIAYLITGNDAYKTKCFEFVEASVSYPYWAEDEWYMQADLAAAHQAYAVSIIYNWLQDDMDADLKEKVLNKLYYTCQRFEQRWYDSEQYMQNHLWINMTGLLSGALAIYLDADDAALIIKADADHSDKEAVFTVTVTADELKANCIKWFNLVNEKIATSFEWMPEDGTNHEGAGYGTYGTEWLLKASLMLEGNLGIDTFTGNGYYANHSKYFLNVMYPKNSLSGAGSLIDYADGTRTNWYGPSNIFRVLAAKYQDETAQWIAESFEDSGADLTGSSFWMGLLFGDDSVEASLDTTKSTLYYSEDMGIVVARSDWSGDESMLFIRSGLPLGKAANDLVTSGTSEYHVDADCNAVILYSNGEYLLKSDGYVAKRTANHSTLLVNGSGQIGEGAIGFVGDGFVTLGYEPTMTVVEDADTYSYFVGDATESYAPELNLKKFERNVVFLKEENVMLIVDDIKAGQSQNLQLRWFPESKSVTEAYGIYSVHGSKNTMQFYPFTEESVTAFEEVDVCNDKGSTVAEYAFTQNYTGTTWQNAVAFSWGPSGEKQTLLKYKAGNANEHKFEVNGKIYTVNTSANTVSVETGTLGIENEWASDSTLSSIQFNGAPFEEFDSAVTEYTLERFWKTKELVISAVPSAPTAKEPVIEWDGSCPGTVTITCTSEDGTSVSTYTLNLKNDNGMLGIESATAVPNVGALSVELTYDNYISSTAGGKTWSSFNCPVVTYDMGSLTDITMIDVAFNKSRDRVTYYNLLISEDGDSWTMLKEAATAEKTPGPALNDYVTIYSGEALRARYVQIALRSHSESGMDEPTAYNSIQEISIYGAEVIDTDSGDDVATVVAKVGGIGYESLQAAIEAADELAKSTTEDIVITLCNNIVYNMQLAIGKGITLDLNGKTLTASGAATFEGYVVDNSTGKTGLLKVPKDQFKFITEPNNSQMPVYNGTDGYVFATMTPQEMFNIEGEGDSTVYRLIFRPYFGTEKSIQDALSIDGNNIEDQFKIIIRLTWKEGTETKTKDLVYADTMVEQVYDNEKAFYINVSGVASFKDKDLTITPMVISKGVGAAWSVNSFPEITTTE